MSGDELRRAVEALGAEERPERARALPVVLELLDALERGRVRAAEPGPEGWTIRRWVKQGILLAFRIGEDRACGVPPTFAFRDRDTLAPQDPSAPGREVRIVPGGTTIRRGAFLGRGVVVMPPSFVNVGAYVGAGTMIDSHVLVGSCAQVGGAVHLSAAVQLGGVLEPIGALPVIVEDGAFIGGGCGIYEGCRVGPRAVLAPGVILSRAVVVHDLVRECTHRADAGRPLLIPEGAVLVPGSRPARGRFAADRGIQLQAPVIVKYRDAGTAAALALERALRPE